MSLCSFVCQIFAGEKSEPLRIESPSKYEELVIQFELDDLTRNVE